MSEQVMDRMKTQSEEFAALGLLLKALNRLPPIVDDEYPEMRHYFESALATFIAAMVANGRFGKGNRFHIYADPPPVAVPDFIDKIRAELARATRKFPTWPTDPLHAVGVLGEEFGELQKEVLQMCYEPHKTSSDAIHQEALQCAAMALRFYMSLGRYEYRPGKQHSQSEA